MAASYKEPGWFTTNVFNRAVAGLTKVGISVKGSRVLAVKGRTSGEWRTTPVNLLDHEGKQYLVAPRGETQWVRNIRVAGGGELHLGKKVQTFTVTEVTGEPTVPILRDYLKHWKWEVGQFFDGVGPDATDEQLLAISPKHPVFEITSPPGG
jgi:deazaflavin-dependent oxidoreductase (nitroreductase family)